LAVNPAFVTNAEEALEEALRNHLRRQSPIGGSPAHVAMNVFAVRLLGHTDLEGAEAGLGAEVRGEYLADRQTTSAAPGIGQARHERAHRLVMSVAGAGHARRGIVDAADHVDVLAQRAQRRQARRQLEGGTGLGWNPVALGNAVSV